jgi:hypothetical protein
VYDCNKSNCQSNTRLRSLKRVTIRFGYTEPSSGELDLLVETAVFLLALGMVPASYICCA